ncbi:HD-GYP domain-containing protein [Bdellovibrionota bacterium FG-2]
MQTPHSTSIFVPNLGPNGTEFLASREFELKSLMNHMVNQLWAKDECTARHAFRVANAAVALGRKLGFDDFALRDLWLSGFLHDIGKIQIEDAILNKPSTLETSEQRVMKTHPERGFELLQKKGVGPRICHAVRYHHERWDGRGYPFGLEREQIPLFSRIIAVVDAFDALANRRPYHQPLGVPDAAEAILVSAGTQFDHHVVKAFFLIPKRLPDRFLPQTNDLV